MLQKQIKSPFQQISPVKYQQTGNLFTRALHGRPSKEYDTFPVNPPIMAVQMKTAPISPLGKGLVPPKIDYACDQTFISKKNDGDSLLLCRETLINNDDNLYCDEQLRTGQSDKTQVKNKARPMQKPIQSPIDYYAQNQKPKQMPQTPQTQNIMQTECQKILEKTSIVLQSYEQDKRQKQLRNQQLQHHNRELENENKTLREKLRYYERMGMNKI